MPSEVKIELNPNAIKSEKEISSYVQKTTNIEPVERKSAPITKLTRTEFILVYVALCLSVLLSSLDQTITATATPSIGAEFKAFDQIAWIGSAYFLTSASFATLYGKLVDIFGRKQMLFFAITVFEIGSAVCGAATSMTMLITARAFQGIGGGGIMSVVMIIISDIVTYEERGKYQGITGAVFGLSSVLGPLLGGTFTDTIGWRWCFYVNIPVGCLALFVCAIFMPQTGSVSTEKTMRQKLKKLDYPGVICLIISVICFTTPVQAGGSTWDWNAWQTITMFCLSFFFGVAFVIIELKYATEPIIPAALFQNLNAVIFPFIALTMGSSFFGVIYYVSVYYQVICGKSATEAGMQLIPFTISMIVLSILTGLLLSKYGKYKPFLVFGSIVMIIGISLLSQIGVDTSSTALTGYLILTGIGAGCMIQMRLLGFISSVPTNLVPIATAVSNFSQTLGGVIGLSVVGSVFTNTLSSQLQSTLPAQYAAKVPLLVANPTAAPKLGAAVTAIVNEAAAAAIRQGFVSCIPFAAILFVLILFVKQYKGGVKVTGVAFE